MPPEVQGLAAEVLDLPAQDRAKILELLLDSFEPNLTVPISPETFHAAIRSPS